MAWKRPEDAARGRQLAAKALCPAGRSARASKAAAARWAKRDAVVRRKNPPKPPLGYVLACMRWVMDGLSDRPGWVEQDAKLAEVLAWVKACRAEGE